MAGSLKKFEIKKVKRNEDERGWLVELFKKNELEKPIKQAHLASLEPKCVRGNHFHKKRTEWFLLISGKIELKLRDMDKDLEKTYQLQESQPKFITIRPKTAHAVRNTSKETAYFISGQSDIYDKKDPDNFFFKLF